MASGSAKGVLGGAIAPPEILSAPPLGVLTEFQRISMPLFYLSLIA